MRRGCVMAARPCTSLPRLARKPDPDRLPAAVHGRAGRLKAVRADIHLPSGSRAGASLLPGQAAPRGSGGGAPAPRCGPALHTAAHVHLFRGSSRQMGGRRRRQRGLAGRGAGRRGRQTAPAVLQTAANRLRSGSGAPAPHRPRHQRGARGAAAVGVVRSSAGAGRARHGVDCDRFHPWFKLCSSHTTGGAWRIHAWGMVQVKRRAACSIAWGCIVSDEALGRAAAACRRHLPSQQRCCLACLAGGGAHGLGHTQQNGVAGRGPGKKGAAERAAWRLPPLLRAHDRQQLGVKRGGVGAGRQRCDPPRRAGRRACSARSRRAEGGLSPSRGARRWHALRGRWGAASGLAARAQVPGAGGACCNRHAAADTLPQTPQTLNQPASRRAPCGGEWNHSPWRCGPRMREGSSSRPAYVSATLGRRSRPNWSASRAPPAAASS